jgi:hypothetical protein
MYSQEKADLIIYNGKIATMEKSGQFVQALAVKDGIILGTGTSVSILASYKTTTTQLIDAKGKTVIPGLNDSHMHVIREGLNYNAELRWDGVKTLKRAMEMLKEQATRTPPGVWIKVIGGWNEYGFEEKRQPTIDKIKAAKLSHDRIAKRIDVSKIPSTMEVFQLYFAGGAGLSEDNLKFRDQLRTTKIPILVISGDHDISFAVENWFALTLFTAESGAILFKARHFCS